MASILRRSTTPREDACIPHDSRSELGIRYKNFDNHDSEDLYVVTYVPGFIGVLERTFAVLMEQQIYHHCFLPTILRSTLGFNSKSQIKSGNIPH